MIMRTFFVSYIIRRDGRRVLNNRTQYEIADINVPICPHFVLINKDHREQKDPTNGSVAPVKLQPIKWAKRAIRSFSPCPCASTSSGRRSARRLRSWRRARRRSRSSWTWMAIPRHVYSNSLTEAYTTPKTMGKRERMVRWSTPSPVQRYTINTLKKGWRAFTVCVREAGM